MKLFFNAVPTLAADCTNISTDPIVRVSAPWTLFGQVYVVTLLDLGLTGPLPTKAYSPLERTSSDFTDAGKFIAGLGNIQIIRYTDSPVGPYDEFLLVPGFWMYEDADGERKENARTCYNGRPNWDIPKHLARFDWTDNADGSTTVKVFPYDTDGDEGEFKPAVKPWFQTTFAPTLVNNVPFSTDLFGWLGVDTTLVQPPLPASHGNGSYGELPGTDYWAKTVPDQSTDDATLGIFNMDQGDGDVVVNGTNAVGDEYYPNFWPNLPRLNLGLRMDNATITFSEATYWNFTKA
ncbi:hypothetical protein IWX90DRAFT_468000 [Phyllosticta citrichinensis]|uniref:Uncharacterized protein n=1 Tax=Phyllosticta citrichinensis TaxID=1130410 RepID=A0ABR1XHZ7_9PEZI